MIFGTRTPVSPIKDISVFRKIRYILELEGELCGIDPQFENDTLRKAVARLNKEFGSKIWREPCNCINAVNQPLNKDGTPRKHSKYMKDWVV
jgi:hypothetical protein